MTKTKKPNPLPPLSAPAPKLKCHKFANLFPLMSENDMNKLIKDIRQNGMKENITLLGGDILDGRNRYIAMDVLGIDPKPFCVEYDGCDPMGFVLSKNFRRQHLSKSQQSMVVVEVSKARKSANLHLSSLEATAADLNVSPRSAKYARKVFRKGVPEVVEAVRARKLVVSVAAVLVDAPPEKQREIIAKGHKRAIKDAIKKLKEDFKQRVKHKAQVEPTPSKPMPNGTSSEKQDEILAADTKKATRDGIQCLHEASKRAILRKAPVEPESIESISMSSDTAQCDEQASLVAEDVVIGRQTVDQTHTKSKPQKARSKESMVSEPPFIANIKECHSWLFAEMEFSTSLAELSVLATECRISYLVGNYRKVYDILDVFENFNRMSSEIGMQIPWFGLASAITTLKTDKQDCLMWMDEVGAFRITTYPKWLAALKAQAVTEGEKEQIAELEQKVDQVEAADIAHLSELAKPSTSIELKERAVHWQERMGDLPVLRDLGLASALLQNEIPPQTSLQETEPEPTGQQRASKNLCGLFSDGKRGDSWNPSVPLLEAMDMC